MFDQLVRSTLRRYSRELGRMARARRVARFRRSACFYHLPHEGENDYRWLLTTCVGGVAGCLLIGGMLLGPFDADSPSNVALASVQPKELPQQPLAAVKESLDGQATRSLDPDIARQISVAYRPEPAEEEEQPVIPARVLSGEIASEYPSIQSDLLPYRTEAPPTVLDGSFATAFAPSNITTITKTPPPEPVDETLSLARVGSLLDQIIALGVTPAAARALVAAIDPVYPANLIKRGQEITVTLDKQQDFYGNDVIYPVRLSFTSGPDEEIVVDADEDGQFVARVEVEGDKERARSRYAVANHDRAAGKIGSSLYVTAIDDGVPKHIIAQMLQVFSYDVDFQRQIKPGDTYEVFYGKPLSGSSSKRSVLLYASLSLSGQKKAYYRHTTLSDGQTAYYDEAGRSANKFLMRTPVSGARLTSGYGFRRHPLLGYTKMHTGVDFGVPYGAPIKAAGSGVIELAGNSGAYGITVRIVHAKGYETLYAHMSGIAAGIAPGVRVNQGQTVGYVGATGRVTGPHLHYEVRLKDKPLNPLKVRAAGGRQLAGKEFAEFKSRRQTILALMNQTPPKTRLARAGD